MTDEKSKISKRTTKNFMIQHKKMTSVESLPIKSKIAIFDDCANKKYMKD